MALERDGPGRLDGQFVEVHGIEGGVEARDCASVFLGEAVDPNGRRGWAHWDADSESYVVDTLDGLTLDIPEANLQESRFLGAEAGGCDLVWPPLPMARIGPSFALKVADTLRLQGYCVIEMPPAEATKQEMAMKVHMTPDLPWTYPGLDFAEIYLGEDTKGAMMFLADAPPPFDLDGELISTWYDHLVSLSASLSPLTEGFLGFKSANYHGGTHVRTIIGNKRQRHDLEMMAATEEDLDDGLVESHLDFARRRKLCMMYAIRSHREPLELWPKADPSAQRLRLETQSGRLVIFRHDQFGYNYSPLNGSEIILQTWMLEEPMQLEISSIQGSQRSLESILGGPTLNPERQVHVMNAVCRFPGGAYRMERDWAAYVKQTDTFISIPVLRFDIDMYWEPAGQFNSSGKSSTRHAGLIGDEELITFDNEFFGMEEAMAKSIPAIQRILLELAQELFTMVGFNYRDHNSCRSIYAAVADIGLEWDAFEGFHSDPTNWLKSNPNTMLSINRLCRMYNLSGPAHQLDTACSASLVACNMAHAYLRKSETVKSSLAMGLQHIIYPWPFIGLSGAGMLGSGGRCKTFDQSANGYNRGEGCGGLFCKVSEELEAIQDRLACYCGSYVNQDGRSASLTAPNGPSQQAVIRGSLTQADIQPDMVSATENHGTGTALGDPIETGSIRAVFRRREQPLPVTSGKTHMGHLEAGAGCIGILKMLCQLTHAAVPPNCHIRQPNAHCDFDGFPGIYPVEVLDLPAEYSYGGCNGFGFGGTNSRCDFFAHRRNDVHRLKNPRRQVVLQPRMIGEAAQRHRPLMPRLDQLDCVTVQCARCLGPMCWLCGVVPPQGRRRHRCTDVRAEAASYEYCSDCYDGGYLRGGPEKAPVALSSGSAMKAFLRGSWSGWSALDEMKRADSRGGSDVWEAEVMLGDTRLEEFYLELHDGNLKQIIQPVAKRASQRIRLSAPSEKALPGLHWLIDGHLEGNPEGTVYRIRLEWSDDGLSVTWAAIGPAPEDWPGTRHRHRYFLVSSLSNWMPHTGSNTKEDKHHWKWFLGKIPSTGRVEFMFVRDEDMSQMVYPLEHLPEEESVPVCGPDDGGSGRRFFLWGKEGESTFIDLKVSDGRIFTSICTESMGRMTLHGSTDRAYYVVASWTGQRPAAMVRDEERPEIWRLRFAIGEAGREEFQIWVNQNPNLRIYPAGGGPPGQDLACGPDRKGARKFWQVAGPPGALVEIVLDLCAEDHRQMVICQPCPSPKAAAWQDALPMS